MHENLLAELPQVESPDDIIGAVRRLGFLPFFRNGIPGFSVEDMTPPDLWFNPERDGPWYWKGPVIAACGCAYGKLWDGKACFVSMDLFPDLLNIRRTSRPASPAEEEILRVIRNEDSLLSTEIKEICGYGGRKAPGVRILDGKALPEALGEEKRPARPSFDALMTKLQMGCRVTVSDFEYKRTKKGRRYGWGIARYTTPESLFGSSALETGRDVVGSLTLLASHFSKVLPSVPEDRVRVLLL